MRPARSIIKSRKTRSGRAQPAARRNGFGERRFRAGAALPQQIVDVLNFALTFEELEAEFYNLGDAARNLIPRETRQVFKMLEDH